MKAETAHNIQQIRKRIDDVRRAMYKEELLRFSAIAFVVIVISWMLFVLVESIGYFDSATRSGMFFSFLFIVSASFLVIVVKPLLRALKILPKVSDDAVARIIGEKYAAIKDTLENTLDLASLLENKEKNSSEELIETAIEEFQKKSSEINFNDTISFQQVASLSKITGIVFASFLLSTIIPHSPLSEASNRLWNYEKSFVPPVPFMFEIFPGSKEIVKGEAVIVVVKIISNQNEKSLEYLPQSITLLYREQGIEKNEIVRLTKDSAGNFSYKFSALQQTIFYKVSAENITSVEYTLAVTERPFIRSMNITIYPLEYSKLPKQQLEENVGDILALAGSRIEWEIIPNKEIASASVVFNDGYEVKFKKSGGKISALYQISGANSYYIELEDNSGLTNVNPIEYKIEILPDANPTVEILYPGKNIDVTTEMKLPLQIKIGDDFEVSRLSLVYRLAQSKYGAQENETRIEIPINIEQRKSSIIEYEWDLNSLRLVPEDVVEYYAEVEDNDNVNGPKKTKSASYLVRLPSLEEIFSDADKAHDEQLKTLENSLKQVEELKKDLEELSRDMKRNQQMDWQKQKKAEDIAKKYQEIQKKIDDVNKAVNEMTEQLNKNNTLSSETLEKYMELQKTLQEMNTPEFREAMKRMKNAMQQMNQEQLQQAMQQAQFSEEQFRNSIERTLNLLKRIQIEQKVDEMLKRSEQLQKEQIEIQKETKNLKQNENQKANELSKKQDDVNKELNDLQKELGDLRNKMEEFPKEMPMKQLSEAEQAANDKKMQSSMKQSSQQLRNMQMQQAMQSQSETMEGLQQMSNEFSQLQEELLSNQQQEAMNGLRKAMQDLLQLSQHQEQLKNQSKNLDPNSQQFRDIAQQQQNIQGDLSNVANQLAELSQKSFVVSPEMGKQIGRAMGQMQQAMTGIENRSGQYASNMQGEAMASLNKSATLMQGAMQQMQQPGGQGGGSLLQQLRNMVQQQMQINMQTQQMGNQQGMSQQQMQEMGRLAKQQEAVRKSLEQLQREAQGNPEKNKIMGDLQKIADEMKEVAQQLEQQQINPNTVRQQERILSRLLQASSSTRERDYEQKRKSETGKNVLRRTTDELTLHPKQNQKQMDLQRAIDAGYSKDYLELIRKYYEALEKNN